MNKRLYLYPVWIRLWHLANAICFLLLIISGISMQYSGPFIALIRFDIAVTMHNFAGVILLLNYLIFIAGNLVTQNGRFYRIKTKGYKTKLKKQGHYYLTGIFKGDADPFPVSKKSKFNPLQKLSYVIVMYLFMPLIVITGMALLFPEMIVRNVFGFSGIHLTALLHAALGFLLSLFMIVHIYFCTFGKTASSNFKCVINGYHESE